MEILNTFEAIDKAYTISTYFIIVSVIVCLATVFLACYFDPIGDVTEVIMIITFSASVVMFIIGIALLIKSDPRREKYMEVKLNSNYSAEKLLSKYDVIEVRGDIYTLKERRE